MSLGVRFKMIKRRLIYIIFWFVGLVFTLDFIFVLFSFFRKVFVFFDYRYIFFSIFEKKKEERREARWRTWVWFWFSRLLFIEI